MIERGIEVERYHPAAWYNLRRANNRTHRKLLIDDGTGGLHGARWHRRPVDGKAQDPEHWRDSHFKIEGPVVAQCQASVHGQLAQDESRVLHGGEYFPRIIRRRRVQSAGVYEFTRRGK
jgi:cardiolipin synthase